LAKNDNGITKKQFEELAKSVKNIESILNLLVNLQLSMLPKPKIGEEESKILKLCDKKHTIADMMAATNKKEGTINATLNHLKAKTMIQTVISDGKTVYERIR
jgi:hypothetical protein